MPYEELSESKVRPVLVRDEVNLEVIVFKMTKHPPRRDFPNEYAVIDWRGAGLRVPMTIRGGRHLRLPKSEFIRKIGTLQAIDILNVREFM
ncbi:MAG: hypothetical protein Q4D04_15675 [Clostridia bacterium]|nr:hypothetical protein [Clostridia bacterium]